MTLGLNDEEVKKSRIKNGSNKIDNKKSNTFLKLLIESLGDPIIKILLIALAIKVVFLFKNFDFYETIGILIAIFLASFISSISEYGSNKAFERLSRECEEIDVRVYRNGKLITVKSSDIVVGDIINVGSGDKLPADGHIISGNLSTDESFLSGETKEVIKKVGSKVYGSSVIYKGSANIKIDSVGINTYIGKITKQMGIKNEDSPLRKRLRTLAGQISKLGYLGAILASLSYLFLKIVVNNHFDLVLIFNTIKNFSLMMEYFIYCLTLCVTIIIMAVPEGLPMMITLVLSSNMKKMLKDNVLVRKMVGIETSGSINVLLCDKTGTLTEGKLSVKKIITKDGIEFSNLNIINYYPKYSKVLYDLLSLDNECVISDKKIIGGNATDQAIRKFIINYQSDLNVLKTKEFDSDTKYSYILASDNNYYIKGASEIILPKCQRYLKTDGQIGDLHNYNFLLNDIKKYTQKGYRVLACAYGKKLDNLIFVGFIILSDSIRKNAKESIEMIKKAGIKPIMITGDAKDTAISIGKEIGIVSDNSIILTHDDLEKYNDEKLIEMLKKLSIVARALPEDKSRLVSLYKKLGYVVGMTGDGINDAIALKKSDVGFALGSGTEVAKEAADIVIMDDNISSICKAVLYGRTIFKSIRKFIIYQLTVNICALLLSIIGTLIGYASPITIVQMLWLNMIMDTFAGLAFSYEPPLLEYMEEHPKKKDEKIINAYMLNQIKVNGLYTSILCILFLKLPFVKSFFRFDLHGNYFLTAFFALFVFLGIINSFLARTHRLNIFANIQKNKMFIFINLFTIIVQMIIIYYGGSVFRTYGLTLKELFYVIFISLSLFIVDFLRKKHLQKKNITLGV